MSNFPLHSIYSQAIQILWNTFLKNENSYLMLFTAHMLLLAAYMLAPSRMSGQADVIKEVVDCQPSSDVSTHDCDRNDIMI